MTTAQQLRDMTDSERRVRRYAAEIKRMRERGFVSLVLRVGPLWEITSYHADLQDAWRHLIDTLDENNNGDLVYLVQEITLTHVRCT